MASLQMSAGYFCTTKFVQKMSMNQKTDFSPNIQEQFHPKYGTEFILGKTYESTQEEKKKNNKGSRFYE